MTTPSQSKEAYNAQAKSSMRHLLRSKSWAEKIESIERMNVANKIAKESMKKALAKQMDAASDRAR